MITGMHGILILLSEAPLLYYSSPLLPVPPCMCVCVCVCVCVSLSLSLSLTLNYCTTNGCAVNDVVRHLETNQKVDLSVVHVFRHMQVAQQPNHDTWKQRGDQLA
jgi:hypothetical protein